MTLEPLILVTSAVAVGAAIGVWTATLRLFAMRMGGPRLPVWLPWAATPLFVIIGLVTAATQLITANGALASTPGLERGAAAIVGLLVGPVWIGSAALAGLGIVLHYGLDRLLGMARLHPVVFEGLAQGVRAAWALIGLLTLLFGLQGAYLTVAGLPGANVQVVVSAGGNLQLVLNLLGIGVALLGMSAPVLIERGTIESPPNTPEAPPPG